ncbi:hypothetical protein [Rhodococcus koreensis]
MSHAATEVQLKFDRSRQHLTELEGGIREYLAREPFSVSSEEDATGDFVYRVQVKRSPPIQLSLPLGDAIHSARSALDYLAWQLVIAGGGTPDKTTAFPISANETQFNKNFRNYLRGASTLSMTAVKALRPFQGGDDRFWRLHKLDIEDKHHLLIPVGAAHRSVNVSFGFPGANPIVVGLKPMVREYPLNNGAEVYRVMHAARESAEQGIGGTHSFGFDVAFGEGVIVSGEPIIPTLAELIGGIENTVVPLFRFLN